MALFGRRTAIVPLGISCLPAHQVERAQVLLAGLADDVFDLATTPFDWRIVGPGDLADMIEQNDPYPSHVGELVGTKRPYWPRRRCHFWHDPAENFADFSSKQAHLWANWARISAAERKVFVLSNAQNNLAQKAKDPGGFSERINSAEIVRLARVLGSNFRRPELHVVTRKPIFDGLEDLAALTRDLHGVKLGLHFIEPDSSQWQGDDQLWDGTFRAIMRGRT